MMPLHVEKQTLAKAGNALAQTFIWVGLIGSALAAAFYDIGHWVQAW
jgi:hypothetical protein